MDNHGMIKNGEKIHLILRRNFDADLRRHFIGEVADVNDTTMRVAGYAFVLDIATNQYIKRPEKRSRIVSFIDANNIINILPTEVDISKVIYTTDKDHRLFVTDNAMFKLDIVEFGAKH